ncbi:hypothetical protein [Streptococcus iniae]|uniref:hypothetical protein n=1 Tax=Streptococcus iniae TaxID=1346 RepID=UPI000EF64B3C|nr:hypothetical protein [Streptococcus iniae]RLV18996.1 hypothetical protein DIX77_04280 [Streptococcus iniae]
MGAELNGIDELLANMEKELGSAKVNRAVNKTLKEVGKELEPSFKNAISVYKRTGMTMGSVAVSGVKRSEGIPKIKLGFTAPRYRLVHLQEMEYGWKKNKRGVGVIRRYSDSLEGVYPQRIQEKLKGEFKI